MTHMEIACTCNWDIPGLDELPAHSHIAEMVTVRSGCREFTLDRMTVDMNPDADWEIVQIHPPSIKIWVKWKQLARELTRRNTCTCPRPSFWLPPDYAGMAEQCANCEGLRPCQVCGVAPHPGAFIMHFMHPD